MERSHDENFLWISPAARTYRSAKDGEELASLRKRVNRAHTEARDSLFGFIGALACGFLIFSIQSNRESSLSVHGNLSLVILFTAGLIGLLSSFGLITSTHTLYKHAGVVRKHEGETRLAREEHEVKNALGRLAFISYQNSLFLYSCLSRWDVYTSLRDSGQVDHHSQEEQILVLLERAKRETDEEMKVVNGLLLRHKYLDRLDLTEAIEKVLLRQDLNAIGLRLARMARLDPNAFTEKIVKANNYTLAEDPRIDELLPLLETRLAI